MPDLVVSFHPPRTRCLQKPPHLVPKIMDCFFSPPLQNHVFSICSEFPFSFDGLPIGLCEGSMNFGERRSLFPSQGRLPGLTAGPHRNANAIFLLPRWCLCAFVCSDPATVCRRRTRTPAQSEQQTLQSHGQAEISLHSSPLLDKLRRKRAKRSPLPPHPQSRHLLAVQSFICRASQSADLLLKQYSTAG